MKSKFKFLITTFVLFLLFFNSFCFANESNIDTKTSDLYSDLYISEESEYEIKNNIIGNAFVSVDTLNIIPNNNVIIKGNLFVNAENVNIKSNISYSNVEKDFIGSPAIILNNFCTISGNVFAKADKFVLESGSEINGDLYIYANEVSLEAKSKVNGNIFIYANTFNLKAEVGGSLYATVNSFNMDAFGYISKDLYLNADKATLNGSVYRNSFITAKDITTENYFINKKDFNIKDANNLTFSGEILGNATINCKNIMFNNNDNIKCKIYGNLSYSSKQQIEIPEGIVSKEISYNNYVNTNFYNNLSDYIINLISTLVCIYVIYLLISKFSSKYLYKLSDISYLDLLKYLGIGLGLFVLLIVVSILLLITKIGTTLSIIILLIDILLLLIAKPIFIISIATFIKNKLSNKINIYLYVLAITIVLSLINLIPYLGAILSLIFKFTGFGMIIKLIKN